jgi:hypothetical protein
MKQSNDESRESSVEGQQAAARTANTGKERNV